MSRWSLKDNIPFVLHDLPFPNRYTKKKRKQRSLPQPPWHPMSVHKLYGNPTDSEEHGCLARASQHSAPLCGSVKIPNKQHLCRRGSEQNERDQEVKPISSLSSTACHWSSSKPEESLACTSQLRRESSLVFLSHCKLTDFHEQNASSPNAQLRERNMTHLSMAHTSLTSIHQELTEQRGQTVPALRAHSLQQSSAAAEEKIYVTGCTSFQNPSKPASPTRFMPVFPIPNSLILFTFWEHKVISFQGVGGAAKTLTTGSK